MHGLRSEQPCLLYKQMLLTTKYGVGQCENMYVYTLQVEELSKAVDVAEKNTLKFGLTQADIMARRKWIMQTKREVWQVLLTLPALSVLSW